MQAIEKITFSNDWVSALFFTLFVGVFLLNLIDEKKLRKLFLTFFNFTIVEDEDAENLRFYDAFQILIFLFSVSVLSLVMYQFKLYKAPEYTIGFVSFLSVFVGLLIYFMIKRFLEYLLILLFMIKKQVQIFIYLKNNYLYSTSFFLYIALILCEYAKIRTTYLFYFTVFLFAIRFIFIIVRNKKLIFNKLFYFILYICALEIAPLFVLFKLMF